MQVVASRERTTAEGAAARGAVLGAIIGFFLVSAFTVAITLNAGGSAIDALGLGAFAGFWGGPGFGGMLGGTLGVIRNEERPTAGTARSDA